MKNNTQLELLVKMADRLDQKGREDLADLIDKTIKQLAEIEVPQEPQIEQTDVIPEQVPSDEPSDDEVKAFWSE